ncbi:MAG: hypothetical protein GY798_02150 [Hyphomicrobiales bacterium]|nr:hypothetical protein [Hyphomicrobiales bacterium]
MLDERGEDALIEDGLSPDYILRHYRASHESNSRNFKHDFPACHVLATIHAGAQNAGVKVIPWQQTLEKAELDRFKLPCTIQHTSLDGNYHNFSHFMVPDGFIGLQANKYTYLTVEVERGNPIEPTKDLKTASALNKFLALRDIHKRAAWSKEDRELPNTKRPLRGY